MSRPGVAVAEVERKLGIVLPERHRQAIADADDPIHQACEFLLPEVPHQMQQLLAVNDFLHAANHWQGWPTPLVAFASNGYGDYFAYNLRTSPPAVVYIDPLDTAEESLTRADRLVFESVDAWYASRLVSNELD